MTQRQHLPEFIATLPAWSGPPMVEEELDPAFTITPVMPAKYVWPDLSMDDVNEPVSIVLVTAPGAMGKSAAAQALAHSLCAPYIDLAKVPIGSDSLTGMLTRVLGWKQTPEFVTRLQTGKASLVLDSLDEAQLAAGREHFLAFMKNVTDLLRHAEKKSQVVIFGRRDTIETAYLALEELGQKSIQVSVAPLNYEQSCALVDLVLDDLHRDGKKYAIHRNHPAPFDSHREATFLDMAHALGCEHPDIQDCWKETGDFLGYPPVLLVLSRHLAVDNPAAFASKATGYMSSRTRGGLLREVVEGILERESAKVRAQMATALGLNTDDPKVGVIYTREEQILRLVGFVSGETLRVALPGALSADERAIYEEQISSFVPDHPFLNGREIENVVFNDYLNAYGAGSQTAQLHGMTYQYGKASEVGPFFAHFVHAMAEGGARKVAREAIVDSLIKSFSAGNVGPSFFIYSDKSNETTGSLLLTDSLSEDALGHVNLFFQIVDRSGVLELSSPIARGLLVTGGAVCIGTGSDEIVLGPDLTLIADDIEIEGKRLSASSTPSAGASLSGGVLLIGTGDVSHQHDLSISAHPPGCLQVSWTNLWHQWRPYVVTPDAFSVEDKPEVTWQIAFGLRRLLTAFHSRAAHDPSLAAERVEKFAVGSNPVFAAVLQGLIDLDIVAHDVTIYRLRLSRLSDYGVNWAALRGSDFASTLAELHRAICKTDAVSELLAGD